MSCDERTALLAAKQMQHEGRQQQQQQQQQRQHHHHIIVVPLGKDPKEYEPIFTTADYSYGLTLEELLPFAADPWWQCMRRLCFASLWLTFLLTLLASLTLAYIQRDETLLACRSNRVITTTTLPSLLGLPGNGTVPQLAT